MRYDTYTPDQIVREIAYIDQQLAKTTSTSRIERFKKKRTGLEDALRRKASRGLVPATEQTPAERRV